MSTEWRLRNFEWAANSPEEWERSSSSLWTASEVLRERRNPAGTPEGIPEADRTRDKLWILHPIELMLKGFALENLMKAVCAKQGKTVVRDGKYIGFRKHDLVTLATAIGMEIDLRKRLVLEQLTSFVTFVGRYPIPTHVEGGFGAGWATPQDYETLNEILRSLRAALA